MGIAQIALDLPPSVKRANVGKSAPNHPGKPFHPRAMWGKKVPQTIQTSLYILPPLTGNAHMERTHFKKGLPVRHKMDKAHKI